MKESQIWTSISLPNERKDDMTNMVHERKSWMAYKMKKMKFMTSNEGALRAAKGLMTSTKEEIVVVGNRSLVKRETRSKFMVKKKLGKYVPS